MLRSSPAIVDDDARWHSLTRISVALICLVVIAAGCGHSYRKAEAIEDATVPAGDSHPDFSAPVSTDHAITFTWAFETHFDSHAYEEWVVAQLTSQGFALVRRQAGLALSRLDGGDAYRLHLEITPSPSGAHVQATLVVTPD